MRRYTIRTLVVSIWIVAVLVGGATARSQAGSIHGVVVDTSGAPLPGATIALLRGSAVVATTVTDAKGEFVFKDVPTGHYAIRGRLAGFLTVTAPIVAAAGADRATRLTMDVASLSETVTVTAESPKTGVFSALKAPFQGRTQNAAGDAGEPQTFARFNTEAYDRVVDNGWIEAARTPLSTFSIDVDTAAYANVRRFLTQRQRPPKDAVRIEELINYFTYDYPQPGKQDAPIAVTTALGDCPWNPAHRLALIGLQARRIDADAMPSRNLVFLIDVSGSMFDPRKLPLVKASLAMLADNLTDGDRVAIVVYAGNSGLVLPPTPGNDSQTIVDALRRLEAGGSTNGGEGLRLAYATAERMFAGGGVNRVVLATDGDFNVGITDQGGLLRLIEEKRRTGITLSVLGFGMDNLKDSTMEKLADAGNGNYSYIDSLDEAKKVLVEQAGGTLVTVAKDVKLQVEFNPRLVGAFRLIGYENRLLRDQDFNDDATDAGDMGAGHSVTALYELVPAGSPIDAAPIDPLKYQRAATLAPSSASAEVMTVKIRYKQPDADRSTLIVAPLKWSASMTPELGFAAAVAEFGMLLRDSKYKGSSSFAHAQEAARRFKGADPHGHRTEFIDLIGAAQRIGRSDSRTDR